MTTPDHELIPLARPVLGDRERELIDEVLESRYLSLGPMGKRFEKAFAGWLGVDDAVAVSSGTTGLHLCVRALGWGDGDRVLTTPLSFIASSNALLYEGAEPIYCDVDPVTLNLDPDAAEALDGDDLAGILAVHIFGYPANLPRLGSLAEKLDISVVEDACQAPGAVDADGRTVGTTGNLTSFAFYPNKQMTTGEGGMLIPTDPAVAERFRSERNQGRAPNMEVLEFDRLGFNYRLSDLAAAVGVAQLERLPGMLKQRSELAGAYRERLSAAGAMDPGAPEDSGLLLPAPDQGTERRSWFVYVIQLPEDVDRDRLIGDLTAAGIQTKPYLPCIHTMPFYRQRFGFRGGEFPVAERFSARALSLPFFPEMTEGQVDRVCAVLLDGLRNQGTDAVAGGQA